MAKRRKHLNVTGTRRQKRKDRLKRKMETDEQRELRLAKDRKKNFLKLQEETPEKRYQRLLASREYKRMRRKREERIKKKNAATLERIENNSITNHNSLMKLKTNVATVERIENNSIINRNSLIKLKTNVATVERKENNSITNRNSLIKLKTNSSAPVKTIYVIFQKNILPTFKSQSVVLPAINMKTEHSSTSSGSIVNNEDNCSVSVTAVSTIHQDETEPESILPDFEPQSTLLSAISNKMEHSPTNSDSFINHENNCSDSVTAVSTIHPDEREPESIIPDFVPLSALYPIVEIETEIDY